MLETLTRKLQQVHTEDSHKNTAAGARTACRRLSQENCSRCILKTLTRTLQQVHAKDSHKNTAAGARTACWRLSQENCSRCILKTLTRTLQQVHAKDSHKNTAAGARTSGNAYCTVIQVFSFPSLLAALRTSTTCNRCMSLYIRCKLLQV